MYCFYNLKLESYLAIPALNESDAREKLYELYPNSYYIFIGTDKQIKEDLLSLI